MSTNSIDLPRRTSTKQIKKELDAMNTSLNINSFEASQKALQSTKKNDFPSARYFQIHFEHLQELINDLKQQQNISNQKISELQNQLSDYIPTLESSKPNQP